MALAAKQAGRTLVLPQQNAEEAALISDAAVQPARHLLEICAHLHGQRALPFAEPPPQSTTTPHYPDLAEVYGQHQARRALEIAAAGNHSVLFYGPPGTGKTMLASHLPGILPPMSEDEAVESAVIASVSGQGFGAQNWGRHPYRAPHHTTSAVALVGGGSNPRPGEISLAHQGILFLDRIDMHVEVPPLPKGILQQKQQMEDSATVRTRVSRCRQRQVSLRGKANSRLENRELSRFCALQPSEGQLLEQATEQLGLSARAHQRILRLARTIADLEGVDEIGVKHLSEAIGYRKLDRQPTG